MRKPKGYWNKKENRIKEIRNAVEKMNKPLTQITKKDFINLGLRSLVGKYRNLFLLLKDAGYNIEPWKMKVVPNGYWDKKENRMDAVIHLVRKLKKPASEVTKKDFFKNGLATVVAKTGSYRLALKEAGYNVEYRKRDVKQKGYWQSKENRVKAVREMVKKFGKSADEIKVKDFRENKLSGLLSEYKSVRNALREAGYDIPPKPDWTKKENRVKAIRDMVEGLNKPLKDITVNEFKTHKLYGLLTKYYNTSSWKALREAGYTLGRTQMHTKPAGYWNKRERRISAIRKMIEKTGKSPMEITASDFIANKLWGMIQIGYNASPFAALKDAGLVEHEWEMKCSPNYWNKKENRINTVKNMVKKLDKPYNKITKKDFEENGLSGLLTKYTDKNCKSFSRGEIFTFDEGYLLEYKGWVKRALKEAEII